MIRSLLNIKIVGLFVIVAVLSAAAALTLNRPQAPAISLTPTAVPDPITLADDILPVATLGRGWINDLAWSPDGETLAAATAAGIWLYEAHDLDAAPRFLQGHTAPVSSIDFSSDGHLLVSGGWDKTLRLWDMDAGTQRTLLEGHNGQVESVAFSPDDTMIVSGGFDSTLRLWDVESGETVATLPGHENTITSVAYSPDGRFIASGSRINNNMVILWDATTQEQLAVLQGLTNFEIESLAFSPDSTLLAAAATDGAVHVWDTDSHEAQDSLTGHLDIAFAPDGEHVVTAGATTQVWSVSNGDPVRTLEGLVVHLALSPDGEQVASVSQTGALQIRSLTDGTEIASLTGWHGGGVNALAFNPAGTTLVAGGGDAFGNPGAVNLWDVGAGQQLVSLPADHGTVEALAVSPSGGTIAVGTEAGVLEFRDGTDGRTTNTVSGHQGRVLSVVFSPDGQAVATGGEDSSARLWDAATGQERASLTNLGGPIRHLNLSADGSLLPSEGVDDVTELAELDNFNVACTAGAADGVTSMLFSPNKQYVASAYWNNTVNLVDLGTGDIHTTLSGHTGNIWSIAFSPDSRYVATGSADRTVRIWEVESGQQVAVLEGHTWDVNTVTFSPDGHLLASGSADGTVRLWQVAAESASL